MSPRPALVLAALTLLALGAATAWWLRAPAATPAELVPAGLPPATPEVAAAQAPGALVVAWSAQGGAQLEPCGCSAGMYGGLVRRASLLARLPRERRLTLEGGGWSGGGADYQLVRAGHYLAGLAEAGCDAVGLGAAEVRLGAAALARVLATPGIPPVVCANLAGAGLRTHAAIERGGRRLAVTAVVPAGAAGDGLAPGDPVAGALAVLAGLPPGTALVVLADLPPAGLEALARALPEAALVVGGDTEHPSPTALRVGAVRVVWTGNHGKTLGWWRWGADACAFELVADTLPEHPRQRARVARYQEQLGAMDLQLDERLPGMTALGGPRTAEDARYVGSQSCTPCHQDSASVHAASAHARALKALEQRGYQRDPDCLRCHVTGLGLADGYGRRGERSHLGEVSCESCHGPGSRHVAGWQAGSPVAGSLRPTTPATCTACHDRSNSPAFDHPVYWTRIRHP